MTRASQQRQSVAAFNPKITASNLTAEIDGVKYRWAGGFGSILVSRESGLKPGDVRMIGNVMFHVYIIYNNPGPWPWSKPVVNWTASNIDQDGIRAIKTAIFC